MNYGSSAHPKSGAESTSNRNYPSFREAEAKCTRRDAAPSTAVNILASAEAKSGDVVEISNEPTDNQESPAHAKNRKPRKRIPMSINQCTVLLWNLERMGQKKLFDAYVREIKRSFIIERNDSSTAAADTSKPAAHDQVEESPADNNETEQEPHSQNLSDPTVEANEDEQPEVHAEVATVEDVPTPLEPAPPDEALAARVAALTARTAELGRIVTARRVEAPALIAKSLKQAGEERRKRAAIDSSERQREIVSSLQAKYATDSDEDSLPSEQVVNTAIATLKTVDVLARRSRARAEDTRRRLGNISTVLRNLADDAATVESKPNSDDAADVNQTIDGDWTIGYASENGIAKNMTSANETRNKNKKRNRRSMSPLPSFRERLESGGDNEGSPIRTHPPKKRGEDEELTLSPFVTPRSKMRRCQGCSLCSLPPL